ncbi:hypothetical protein [Burkholderia pseudomultivorans]|uniref:hypothetical protein n=1 Tax=Burkholderia pseudomultivorans TaxID=1207504 RepID=UPI0012DAF916|nr:hypothetical protein [Burkholderia pseudomultivorans]
MKRLYLRVLKVCAGIVLLGAIGAVACLQHPLFGALPQGERLARILRSPNYAGGAFRNQIDSPMLMLKFEVCANGVRCNANRVR